jgi:hypothetical protein
MRVKEDDIDVVSVQRDPLKDRSVHEQGRRNINVQHDFPTDIRSSAYDPPRRAACGTKMHVKEDDAVSVQQDPLEESERLRRRARLIAVSDDSNTTGPLRR